MPIERKDSVPRNNPLISRPQATQMPAHCEQASAEQRSVNYPGWNSEAPLPTVLQVNSLFSSGYSSWAQRRIDEFETARAELGGPNFVKGYGLFIDSKEEEAIPLLEAAVAGGEHNLDVLYETLGCCYRNLSKKRGLDEGAMRTAIEWFSKSSGRLSEFTTTLDLFSYKLVGLPFREYMPFMRIARLVRPYDKQLLENALRMLPAALRDGREVAWFGTKLLRHRMSREAKTFIRTDVVPVLEKMTSNPPWGAASDAADNISRCLRDAKRRGL